MKVRVLVEQEVEANVCLEDVMAELASLPVPERSVETLHLLSLCLGAVKRVPDALVDALTDGQRRIVVDALRGELERYQRTLVAASTD